MGWGAMMGLGQGLQQVGGMMMDDYKTKLANKLETDREQHKEDFQKALLDRADAQKSLEVQTWTHVQDPSTKAWTTIGLNSQGKQVAERPTDPMEVTKFEADQQLAGMKLQDMISTIGYRDTRKELYPETVAANIANKEARTEGETMKNDQQKARAGSLQGTGIDPGASDSMTQKQLEETLKTQKLVPPSLASSFAKTSKQGDGSFKVPVVDSYENLDTFNNTVGGIDGKTRPTSTPSYHKKAADEISAAAMSAAQAVVDGKADRREVEAFLRKQGYGQIADGLDSWIKAYKASQR